MLTVSFIIREDAPGYGTTTGAVIESRSREALEAGIRRYKNLYPVAGYDTHAGEVEELGGVYRVRMTRSAVC